MDKIYSWEHLTGEKVEIETNTMCTDVTFWRPKIGTSIKRKDEKSLGSERIILFHVFDSLPVLFSVFYL